MGYIIYMAKNTLCTKNPSGNRKLSSGRKALYSTYRPTTKINKEGEITFQGTCPNSCPLLGKCYANFGNSNLHNIRSRERNDNVTDWIKQLPQGSIVRHLVTGDLTNPETGTLDTEYFNEALEGHKARPDIMGYGYTHDWKNLESDNLNQLPNLVINASTESEADTMLALALGWPVARVVPMDAEKVTQGNGFKNVVCPNQTIGLTCDKCKLCAVGNRENGKGEPIVIAFRAHGNNKAEISKTVGLVGLN